MADRELNFVVKGKDEASGPFGKVKKSLDGMSKSSGGLKGALGRAGGAIVGFAKIAAVAVVGGIGLLAGALAGAVKAAMDEEIVIARLDKALAANVKGYDGNREAIEKVIDARTRFAFDDGDLRDSLGTLVTRTGDVTKAFDLQAIAMDLARSKNIDLKTASEIIGKVYDGNLGILSRYGIALGDAKTGTEALAKIQDATKGQAEAYGNTTKGAFDKFQIAMGNVIEDVGVAFLPAMADIARFLSDTVIPAVKDIIGQVQQWFKDNAVLIGQIRDFLIPIVEGIGTVIKTVIDTAVPIIRDVFIPAFQAIWDIVSKVIDVFSNLFDDIIKPAVDAILPPLRTVVDGVAGAFNILLGFVRDLAGIIGGVIQGLKDVVQFAADAIDAVSKLSLAGATEGIRAEVNAAFGREPTSTKGRNRASGGPVAMGRRYVVGEKGPEWFVPRTSGSIIPNSGTGGNLTVGSVTINGSSGDPRKMADEFFREVQRGMTRQGISALVRR